MLLAIDVYYKEYLARAIGVLFDWEDESPQDILIELLEGIEEYIPGEFYKRELPCLLKIVEKVNLSDLEAIIVDGHVNVENEKYGLGGKLYEQLYGQVPVIGIAKSPFYANKDMTIEIYRGKSKMPLYISSIGIDLNEVVEKVINMTGEYRIPNILKTLDMLTKK
jgi:deoxyribonuclease V